MSRLFLFALAGAVSAFGLNAHSLEASPSQVLFNTLESSAQVTVSDAGKTLGKGDIKSWRFLVDDSDYKHMIKVTPTAGGFEVRPSATLQVGTYDLEVTTSRGVLVIPVNAPLTGESGVLEESAAVVGEDAARMNLGLAQPMPRASNVRITLPPSYVVGQELRAQAPAVAGVAYRWNVNGTVVKEGAGADTLSYILPAEGEYRVTLEQQSAGGAWQVASEATTMAQEQAPQILDVKRNQRLTMRAPSGYGKYTWTQDGVVVGSDSSVVFSSREPGTFTIQCRCEQPAAGPVGGFYNVRYQVTVP